jgi:hypothetical protein
MEWRRIDGILALGFLGVGCAIGYRFLFEVGVTNFSQHFMPAIVMWACGQGFAQPTTTPPMLDAFLNMEITSFDCRDLMSVGRSDDAGVVFHSHFYLGLATAVCWRLLGVSYASLAPLLGILYGSYASGCFVLLRLFISRWWTAFAAVVVLVSPVAISMLSNLRDFSKAPFVVWGVVLLVVAIRSRRPRTVLVIAGLLGLVVGVGTGFRADVKLMLMIAIIVLAFGLDRAGLNLRFRIASLFVFAAVSGTLNLASEIKPHGGIGAPELIRSFFGISRPTGLVITPCRAGPAAGMEKCGHVPTPGGF